MLRKWGGGGEGHSPLPSRNTLYDLFHDTPLSLIFLTCFFFLFSFQTWNVGILQGSVLLSPAHFPLLSSVQFSRSVVSDSLRTHELQHTRPPCPSQLLEFTQTHVHRVGDAIQPSHPLASPSPPAPNPSQHQSLFQ